MLSIRFRDRGSTGPATPHLGIRFEVVFAACEEAVIDTLTGWLDQIWVQASLANAVNVSSLW